MEVRKTAEFADWLDNLRDLQGRARIQARIARLTQGNPGDAQPVGEGVSELRVHTGPGYRVYFKQHRRAWVVLLAGG
jgi:putative addiction module killer protein